MRQRRVGSSTVESAPVNSPKSRAHSAENSGTILFGIWQLAGLLLFCHGWQHCNVVSCEISSFRDLLMLKPTVWTPLAMLFVASPWLSLLYIRLCSSSNALAPPTAPKAGIVPGTAHPCMLALIHTSHYLFVFMPCFSALLCFSAMETLPALPGPIELLPIAFLAQTWGYYHAIIEHDLKGWQFEKEYAERDTLAMKMLNKGMHGGMLVQHACMATVCLGQSVWLWIMLIGLLYCNTPGSFEDWRRGINSAILLPLSIAGNIGTHTLYGNYGGWLVYVLGVSTIPGLVKLMATGDQRWHLLESIQAMTMMSVQHWLLANAISSRL